MAETATLCVIPLTATICVRTALASLKMAALAAITYVRALAATLCVRREELKLRARGVDPGRRVHLAAERALCGSGRA